MDESNGSVGVRVALAQMNATVGDFAGNVERIVTAAEAAHRAGCALLIVPELALCGYSPEDLLLRPSFMRASADALAECARRLAPFAGLQVVVGHPHQYGAAGEVRSKSVAVPLRFNAASLLADGAVVATYAKRELPNYQVFDERRTFASGRDAGLGPLVVVAGGRRFGILVCEDAWFEEPAALAVAAGADALCVINASPYHLGKLGEREARMAERARATGCPLLYVALTGGQDETVFDGGSFGVSADGTVGARAPLFEEALLVATVRGSVVAGPVAEPPVREAEAWAALVTGVRDYVGKNGFPGVILGLSGGVDSALVLAIAVDALGADRVRTVMMPSRYTAGISEEDATEMARRVGVRHDTIAIGPVVDAFAGALAAQFSGLPEDATEENIQARARGTLLMALSNKSGWIVLTTGNKSEMATGYCTLYGDMAGGFAVIKDVVKTLVYRLAAWRNAQGDEPIPRRILERPPSAELRADQTDQDSLPPYDVLDAILEAYMEDDRSIDEIVAEGLPREDVLRVTRLIRVNEYKRRQAPVGIRITHRAFGRDWRYPITSKFRQ
jgi:NAD+ synthase (glutamine-hydrolysing)